MNYPLFIVLGLAPSIIWLLFFLRKDVHPESNRMILKIFFYGMLVAVVAALVEIGLSENDVSKKLFDAYPFSALLIYGFLGIALTEELFKYMAVRWTVLPHPEFDEPVDAMLYMIILALGFAALENMLVLLPIIKGTLLPNEAITISVLRFVGATFLHALASGMVGYFLALSLLEPKKRWRLLLTGLGIATVLHGLFNFFILRIEANLFSVLVPVAILTGLAFFVSFGFRKLKNIASICKIPQKL